MNDQTNWKPATPLPFWMGPDDYIYAGDRVPIARMVKPSLRGASAADAKKRLNDGVDNYQYIVHACSWYQKLVKALRELHTVDERKLAAIKRRTLKIGIAKVRERVERNRALLRAMGE